MVIGSKIPYVSENKKMKDAIKIITEKKLGVVIVKNKKNLTQGIITDGNVRTLRQENKDFSKLIIKKVMTKNPISIDIDTLAVKALQIMNEKKITSLCVFKNKNKKKTVGLIHIHHILDANIG